MVTRVFTWLLIVGSLYALGGVRAAAHGPASSSALPHSASPSSPIGMLSPIQEARLSAGEPGAFDHFGSTVAVSGAIAVVGAPGHDVLGARGQDAGAAYVYERDAGGPGTWGQVKKLIAGDWQAGDRFGSAVAINGNTIVIGAEREDGGGGDPHPDAGAAYVFERDVGGAGNWGQVRKLKAGDIQSGDRFGAAVGISGNTVVVGAYWEDGGQGNPNRNTGAAYLFERDQGGPNNWGPVARLTAGDAQPEDWFGFAVGIAGDTIVVGAVLEDGPSNLLPDAGAAYVFDRNHGGPDTWNQVRKLTTGDRDSDDGFGISVSVSGRIIVVGATGEDGGPGDPLPDAGAAYVFERNRSDPTSWSQVRKLAANDLESADEFGVAVAVSGSTVVVGATKEDGGPGGPVPDAGAAYLFERNAAGAGSWGQVARISASDTEQNDWFGAAVAATPGRTLLVGAHGEDGGPGDPEFDSGAAYLFCPDDDLEPNDGVGSAHLLAPGTYQGLQICAGDPDYYQLTVQAGDTLDLSAIFIHAEGNLDMHLFDEAMSQVVVSNSTTNNEMISYQAPTTGSYFLQIAGADGGEINQYTLIVNISTASSDTYLPLVTTRYP